MRTKLNLVSIVDDDPIFVFGLTRIMQLADFCHEFVVYKNGEDALSSLEEAVRTGDAIPELILLDLNMPVMNGWQFLNEIIDRDLAGKTRICVVTSSIHPEDIKRSKSYSEVSDFLTKPLAIEHLKKILHEYPE